MNFVTISPMTKVSEPFVEGKFTHVVSAYYRTNGNTSVIPAEPDGEQISEDIRKLHRHFLNYLGHENVSPFFIATPMMRQEMVGEDHPYSPSGPHWFQTLSIFGVNL